MGNAAAAAAAGEGKRGSARAPPRSDALYDENSEHFVLRGRFFRAPGRAACIDPRDGSKEVLLLREAGLRKVVFATGCFWGAEKGFWRLPKVHATAVGYIAGKSDARNTPPTYRAVCSGKTGHAECTLVLYDPCEIALADLLRQFWRCHDPTQGDRQGQDRGSQYRSGIYVDTERDLRVARASKEAFGAALSAHGYPEITTEILMGQTFWYAEPYHQCYLAKPGNRQYCSAEPTGVEVPAFELWNIENEDGDNGAPKLPPAFWKTFDSSVRAPHSPAVWSGGPEAEAQALAAAAEASAKWQHEIEAAQKASGVTIRYCGGCGFRHRADELSDYLLASTGVRAELLEDPGQPTGNFDVSVRRAKGGGDFELVHSKKQNEADGFVDSVAKLERILRAMAAHGLASETDVEKALTSNSTKMPRSVLSPMGRGESEKSAQALLDVWTDPRCPLVMFAKSWCKHCARARTALEARGVHPFVIDIDRRADEEAVQALLGDATGSTTVPSIWRRGVWLGGADQIVASLNAEDLIAGDFADGDNFDGWAEKVGVAACWAWLDGMAEHPDSALGVHFYKWMGDGHLRVPRSTERNRAQRPPL
jgi:peptide-methionine (S)-S-oxide reductase